MMNDYLYEAIKMSFVADVKGMYNYFKRDTENLRGVIIQFNSSKGLGEYLKCNPNKITDFIEYLANHLNFSIKLILTKDGEDEYYPLIEN